jgi:hypothetical protein
MYSKVSTFQGYKPDGWKGVKTEGEKHDLITKKGYLPSYSIFEDPICRRIIKHLLQARGINEVIIGSTIYINIFLSHFFFCLDGSFTINVAPWFG